MKIRFTLLCAACAILAGCEAFQPFARADKDGYEAGVHGTWTALASALKPAPAAGRNGSFKEVAR